MDESNQNVPISFLELFDGYGSTPSDENIMNEAHHLSAYADNNNNDIYLEFSSRLAMYDFARSLMHTALFDKGDSTELYQLGYEDKLDILNGVRLTLDSCRIFIFYPYPKK